MYFAGQAIARLAWKRAPSYSMISNSVSDLGVTICGTVKFGGLSGYYIARPYISQRTPGSSSGAVLLTIGINETTLQQVYGNVTQVGLTTCTGCMNTENDLPVYLATGPSLSMAQLWPLAKHFD